MRVTACKGRCDHCVAKTESEIQEKIKELNVWMSVEDKTIWWAWCVGYKEGLEWVLDHE